MNFLSAHWRDLLLANYVVEPSVLQEFVPRNTTLDAFEGRVFVTLVAFLFDRTRVLGVPVPGHRSFEEVNLRFYVTPDRDRSICGVTFIQEIVPKPLISCVANTLFHENYCTLPMRHGRNGREFWFAWGKSDANRFSATVEAALAVPAPGSCGEFITEHYWGYARGRRSTREYHVTHPPWKCCEVTRYELDLDFAQTYGERFGFLSTQTPFNVLYAAGSAVTVSFPRRL